MTTQETLHKKIAHSVLGSFTFAGEFIQLIVRINCTYIRLTSESTQDLQNFNIREADYASQNPTDPPLLLVNIKEGGGVRPESECNIFLINRKQF